jgi:hypothetical protein
MLREYAIPDFSSRSFGYRCFVILNLNTSRQNGMIVMLSSLLYDGRLTTQRRRSSYPEAASHIPMNQLDAIDDQCCLNSYLAACPASRRGKTNPLESLTHNGWHCFMLQTRQVASSLGIESRKCRGKFLGPATVSSHKLRSQPPHKAER